VLRDFSGARIRRVIDRSHCGVPEHAHDWPVLSLFVMGSYVNATEIGEELISGPSAVLYRAGAAHRNRTLAVGFEQIEIEFDPTWLGRGLLPGAPVTRWTVGRTAAQARQLVHICEEESSEPRLRAALQRFLQGARTEPKREVGNWVKILASRLREDTRLTIAQLSREAGRHPSWIGTAYRQATGEGLLETAARLRVERATRLLRESDQSLASVASEAGFCDQSHMNRTLKRVLGRTPAAVRRDRRSFRALPGAA
jgi:AraC family transcriptional regulator